MVHWYTIYDSLVPDQFCNKGSGIGHHIGYKASVVTPSNDQDKIKYNIFLLTHLMHILTVYPPFTV